MELFELNENIHGLQVVPWNSESDLDLLNLELR